MDAPTDRAFQLVVGLGNPGAAYALTRHNVGFMILDHLAARLGFGFRAEPRWRAEVARHEGVWFCKPLTFMNLSGESVRGLAGFYRIDPARVLAVFDDAALPLGRLRFRTGGSAGGHNGMRSLIDHLGTQEVPRLKVGIGAAQGAMTGHVLGKFSEDERESVRGAVARAAEAVEFAQANGLPAAMNLYN